MKTKSTGKKTTDHAALVAASPLTFDCATLFGFDYGSPWRGSYAHEYDGYLAFFRLLGHSSVRYGCHHVPMSWAPFIRYLGHNVLSTSTRYSIPGLDWLEAWNNSNDKRHVVEIASTTRPELVHGLYLADTEWPVPLRANVSFLQKFPVTNNGSFFRAEVEAFRRRLRAWEKPEEIVRAVVVPCAAEKPYPAALHRAVLERVGRLADAAKWHLIIATGVLGLAPQELWSCAPSYDSGLPNLDRVTQTTAWYFTRHRYERVVVFSDFYAYAFRHGMLRAFPESGTVTTLAAQSHRRPKVEYLFGHNYRDTYENVQLVEHLDRLENALRKE